MGFRKVVFFFGVAFLCVAGTARAQLGVYGMYEGTKVSNVTCLALEATPPVPCSSANGKVNPFGGVIGAYYDFKTLGPVRLGVDLRGEFLHSNKSAADDIGGNGATRLHSGLAGVRASFHTPITWLHPYGQMSFGWASSDVTEPACLTGSGTTTLCGGSTSTPIPRKFDNFLKYEGFAGADLRVFPILDVRVIELGYGGMTRFGTGNGNSSLPVMSIGAGLVFHLP